MNCKAMESSLIDKSDRKHREAKSTALPAVYLLTLVGFVVVASVLITAGRRFNVESVAIQKQVKTLSEQQILSERLKTIVTEHWFPQASTEYLEDQLQEATVRMKAVLGRLEMFSESKVLADFYSDEMRFYLLQLKDSWATAVYEMGRLPGAQSGLALRRMQHTCDQLLQSGAYLMQETFSAQHANQVKRTTLLYIFAASLALLGVIMLWALWSASSNRMEILGLTLQLERRVAERTVELEKINMFLSNVQSSICSALVVIDPGNRVVTWNPAAEKLWGVSHSEAEGQDVFSVVPLENAEDFRSALLQAQQTLQTCFLKEVGMKDAHDQRRCGNASLVPMLGPLAELRGVVILIDDVTERVQARSELAARADEIAETNQMLKRVNNDMEQFVYAASHDLRSPLINMHGLTRKLDKSFEEVRARMNGLDGGAPADEMGHMLDHDIPKLLFRINRSIGKFGSIIDGLLQYSRTGREEYRMVDVNMTQEVAKVIELCAATIEEKGVQIYVDDLPPARGDVDAINKVLANLVDNALNYLDPDRDGEMVIEGKELDNGMCMYLVRDNGVGIREEDLERVFKIFERLSSGSSDGEGLGLAIVKKIIERHGGEISVESCWGEGTTFWFTLHSCVGSARALISPRSVQS